MFFKKNCFVASASLLSIFICSACSGIFDANGSEIKKQVKCINETEAFYEASSGNRIKDPYLVGNYDDYFKEVEELGRFRRLGDCTITVPPVGQEWVDCKKVDSVYYRSYQSGYPKKIVLNDVLKAEIAGNISVRGGTTPEWRGSCLVKSSI